MSLCRSERVSEYSRYSNRRLSQSLDEQIVGAGVGVGVGVGEGVGVGVGDEQSSAITRDSLAMSDHAKMVTLIPTLLFTENPK